MTADTLLTYAQSRKHEVIYTNTSIAFSVEESRQCYIAIPRGLSSVDEKEALAHELGHCEYGGFYNRHSKYDIRAKAERRADKWGFCQTGALWPAHAGRPPWRHRGVGSGRAFRCVLRIYAKGYSVLQNGDRVSKKGAFSYGKVQAMRPQGPVSAT